MRPPTPYGHVQMRVLQPPLTPYAHVGRGRLETRTPHSMKAFQVERRGKKRPFRKDVVAAPQQEPSGAVTLFEETED